MSNIPKQALNILRQVAQSDAALSPFVIKQAQDFLASHGRGVELDPAIEAFIPQLAILLVRDRGGSVTYSVKEIDSSPTKFLMSFKAVKNGKAIKASIVRKGY